MRELFNSQKRVQSEKTKQNQINLLNYSYEIIHSILNRSKVHLEKIEVKQQNIVEELEKRLEKMIEKFEIE